MKGTQAGFTIPINLIIALVVCGFLAAAVMLLPKGFSDDLSKIGQGSAVVVLTHNKNSAGSLEFMELLNKVRADYSGKVDFLAVDVNTNEGRAFLQQQQVGDAELLLFGPDGARQAVISGGITEMDFRSALERIATR